jgi:hypothetical protein
MKRARGFDKNTRKVFLHHANGVSVARRAEAREGPE